MNRCISKQTPGKPAEGSPGVYFLIYFDKELEIVENLSLNLKHISP